MLSIEIYMYDIIYIMYYSEKKNYLKIKNE